MTESVFFRAPPSELFAILLIKRKRSEHVGSNVSDCCKPKETDKNAVIADRGICAGEISDCDATQEKASGPGCCEKPSRFDYFFWIPLSTVIILYSLHLLSFNDYALLNKLSLAVFSMMNIMAWGVAIGVFMVALLSYVPRELVISAMGTGGGLKGICRATAAGVLLDLCSHGILMVGVKLYERGVSIGQVMAFLIASPWNSFSLTIILVAFIGLPWTLLFIALSVIVAIISGLIFDICVNKKILPTNPNAMPLPDDFQFWATLKLELSATQFSISGAMKFLWIGLSESRTVIRWLLIGVLLASLIRVFVDDAVFHEYFGPSMLGLVATMVAATIIEVCSEGATPIAGDIFNRAAAPGNSFAFLMAGVSTDYTEIAVLKSQTRSWKIALFLPLITLPQILLIAIIVNAYGGG